MNMQSRGSWLAAQLAEAVIELFLKVVREIRLSAEEDDATLGNYTSLESMYELRKGPTAVLVMARSRSRSSALSALNRSSTILTLMNSRPITGVVSSYENPSRAPDNFRGSGAWSDATSSLGSERTGISESKPGAILVVVVWKIGWKAKWFLSIMG